MPVYPAEQAQTPKRCFGADVRGTEWDARYSERDGVM
jgi:hypothetical protein